MLQQLSQTSPKRKRLSNKLIAGFAAFAATAVITASGFAAAATSPAKPTKEACQQAGYTNYGQCVKDWAHTHGTNPGGNGNGSGYGGNGGNTVNVSNSLEVNLDHSDNNIINVVTDIVINIFN